MRFPVYGCAILNPIEQISKGANHIPHMIKTMTKSILTLTVLSVAACFSSTSYGDSREPLTKTPFAVAFLYQYGGMKAMDYYTGGSEEDEHSEPVQRRRSRSTPTMKRTAPKKLPKLASRAAPPMPKPAEPVFDGRCLDSVEAHIEAYYPALVEALKLVDFTGPFGRQVAKYALIRQVHEDGVTRSSSKSMVGMIPGGVNTAVVTKLEPFFTKCGIRVKKVGAHDGLRSYAMYGENANVWSGVAIALVWDKYLEEFRIKESLKEAWKRSKALSRKISEGKASEDELREYYVTLHKDREKAFHRVNRIFGGNAAKKIKHTVAKMSNIFRFAELAASDKKNPSLVECCSDTTE